MVRAGGETCRDGRVRRAPGDDPRATGSTERSDRRTGAAARNRAERSAAGSRAPEVAATESTADAHEIDGAPAGQQRAHGFNGSSPRRPALTGSPVPRCLRGRQAGPATALLATSPRPPPRPLAAPCPRPTGDPWRPRARGRPETP